MSGLGVGAGKCVDAVCDCPSGLQASLGIKGTIAAVVRLSRLYHSRAILLALDKYAYHAKSKAPLLP